jgi:hypothetical protein
MNYISILTYEMQFGSFSKEHCLMVAKVGFLALNL